ncbi:site-specific integrase [Vibrio parahaemolyticus]|uniref:Site-specific integrase n=2 Tax=Vibrio parahaemolyticus TaxID=670 RepID=A0A9Q3YPK9_VIBPH|nr:tyrosine-type recombinase/integrase [Vibrio parahaemolyticus]PWF65657.1 integrase [Vibrio sp. T21]EGQ7683545.1 tyrosine-type recombinase/integrase [Vibrio parahaemolyticus]EGQ7800798.1 tyrosine-type recombinase/integrase [Vibrio parahaemolyticus]EGQ8084354.1 tyrosine-type recombinase/integrase [Vibrio parahaemolyticus]EGQ8112898.1 tyrosine-type recombinase/integrase [Vibrio parahaemolyticus]
MAVKKKITNTSIKQLTIEDGRLNDTEISGFHARISPKGAIKYYFYYRLNGKQRNYLIGSADSMTPAQARDLAKEKAGLVASGVDVQVQRAEERKAEVRRSLTLGKYLEEHYKDYLFAMNPKTAKQSYQSIANTFAFLADKPLEDIKAWDIQQWVTEKRKLGRAPATIEYTFNRLKAALSRAVEWEFIESHNLSSVKIAKEDNTRIRYLSESEEAALLNALAAREAQLCEDNDSYQYADFFTPLITLAMHTGMRKGEMLTLRWESVSFENRYLTILSENAKSKKKRTIPMNDTVFNMLSQWRAQNLNEEYVFVHEGKQVSFFQYPWQNLLKAAGIENFRFHDLRHHFASKLVMAGVDLNVVRELLGHADLKMTLRYAHLAPAHTAAAVQLIG